MEQFVGMSKTGSIKEAAEGLKNPQFLSEDFLLFI